MSTATCPSDEDLKAYAWGIMPPPQEDFLADHLDTCPRCETTVQTLERQGDPLLARLRVAVEADPYQQEPECRQVVNRLLDATIAFHGKAVSGQEGAVPLSPLTCPGPFREYELLEILGHGGMGVVYKARHRKLNKLAAIKILPSGMARDPQRIARFKREMKAIGQLDHTHIVCALDAGEAEGRHYLALEYIEGLDLSKISDRVGRLAVADACEVVRQVAVGLRAADERGLIHRDIKPSNLMLTSEGQVKILDLGLAVFETDRPPHSETTAYGQIVGTPDYIAPEQINDAHSVDARADIYSLGCTFYKLLAGESPYSGPRYTSHAEKMSAHLRDPIPPIRVLLPKVPEKLAALLDRMVAKDRDLRTPKPGQLVDELAAFCAGADLTRLVNQAQSRPLPHADAARLGEGSAMSAGSKRASDNLPSPERSSGARSVVSGTNKDGKKADFDPYHKWLGIQPVEQPPTHYRLLGLQAFESDPEVIGGAVMRQSAHLKTYQLGEHAALTQKILNEVSAAKVCLLDPQRKTAYDERLRKELEAREKAARLTALLAAKRLPANAGSPVEAIPLDGPEIIPDAIAKPISAESESAVETGLADLFSEIGSAAPPAGSSATGRTAPRPAVKGQSAASTGGRARRRRGKSHARFWQLCLAAIPPRYRTRGRLATGAGALGAVFLLLGFVVYVTTDYGTIKIELSELSAKAAVKIDGDAVAIAVLKDPLTLKAGPHKLLVSSGGFETVTHSFTVHRGDNSILAFTLEPKPDSDSGTVKIELSDPSAKVDMNFDGSAVGIAGLKVPLKLKAGPHELLVTSGKFETVKRSFAVHRGENSVLAVTLEPKPDSDSGTVKIELSDPSAKVDVRVDGSAVAIAGLKVPLKLKAGPDHELLVTSGEFETVRRSFTVHRGDNPAVIVKLEPRRRSVPPFDWEQNIETAKKSAAERRINVLIVFDSSDSKESSFASSRFSEAVASRSEFTDRSHREYACVYIDSPINDEAKKRVQDLARNRAVTSRFKITVFPTVVVTDDRGLPYGVMDGYSVNGISAFLQLMDKWRADRAKLFELLEKVNGSRDTGLIREALDFLKLNKLDRFYTGTIRRLTAMLPKAKVRDGGLGLQSAQAESAAPPRAVAPFDAEKAKEYQAAWANYLHVAVVQTNSIRMKLVLIPPGEFQMGSPKELIDEELKAHPNDPWYNIHLPGEGPEHRVRITKPFWLGAMDVTQEEYQSVMGGNPSKLLGNPKRPVDQVSWEDAVEFCRKLSELPREKAAKHRYGLPTEAQWEYACRAGSAGRWCFSAQQNPLPLAGEEKLLHDYASFKANAGDQTHPVGLKHANAWGLYDMHGNVWQWCQDWYDKDYYAKSATDDPAGPPRGSYHVLRGGGWYGQVWPWTCRSAFRYDGEPDSRRSLLGFRVALVPAEEKVERAAEKAREAMAVPLGPATNAPARAIAPFDEDKAKEHQAAWAKHLSLRVVETNSIKIKLLFCPPGSFTMGSPGDEEARSTDEDHVAVTISRGFYLGKYSVTQKEFKEVMEASPWAAQEHVEEGDDYPATYVDSGDAAEFSRKLTVRDSQAACLPQGYIYALPTEAQREYACSAGTTTAYSLGSGPGDLGDCAWWSGNCKTEKYAHRVGRKKPNPWGFYDMHGNVWEWCRDSYANQLPGGTDPFVENGSQPVGRGGGWHDDAPNCRSASRDGSEPWLRSYSLGFRVALVPTPKEHESDALAPGSVWKGRRSYLKGQFQGVTVSYELHVQVRDGAKFEGFVFDNGPNRNRAEVEGEVNGATITWRESARGNVLRMEAQLNGDTLAVKFSGRYANGVTNIGDGTLTIEK